MQGSVLVYSWNESFGKWECSRKEKYGLGLEEYELEVGE